MPAVTSETDPDDGIPSSKTPTTSDDLDELVDDELVQAVTLLSVQQPQHVDDRTNCTKASDDRNDCGVTSDDDGKDSSQHAKPISHTALSTQRAEQKQQQPPQLLSALVGEEPNDNHSVSAPVQALATWIRSSRRILVLSGAGVSVAAGIPDFRSKGTGLVRTTQYAT
jgi:hypothetical protein